MIPDLTPNKKDTPLGKRLTVRSRISLVGLRSGAAVFTIVLLMATLGRHVYGSSRTVSAIVAGDIHTCALLSDGTVKCWGQGSLGRLGSGATADSPIPVTVTGISSATAIAAGGAHTCAVLSGGTVRCWGDNEVGQLGNGTQGEYSAAPVKVIGVSNATAIGVGLIHTCALTVDGEIKCWGTNQNGLLGVGIIGGIVPTPVTVQGISHAIAIAVGGGHNCALNSDGTVKCWGRLKYVNANEKERPEDSSTPFAVPGLSKAIAISAGSRHTCALISDGTVKCWGRNDYGQLGNGTTTHSLIPVAVIGISNAKAVATGSVHTCALISDGTVKCWGIKGHGILGNTTNEGPQACGNSPCSTTPVVVNGISTAAAISAGKEHTCALLLNGVVKCWGWNKYGQLGNVCRTESCPNPVEVAKLLE